MAELVIPTLGSKGFFELRAPFDSMIVNGTSYTCCAIRKLNDYLANSEDPYNEIYKLYHIESDYDADLKSNMPIVSLQSDLGHWLYVPASYIITYPITNGIPYRAVVIGVALPSIPTTQDLSHVETALANVVYDFLGVTPEVKTVEASQPVLVSREKHTLTQATRTAAATNSMTDRARYTKLLADHQTLLDRLTELENYIIRIGIDPDVVELTDRDW